jgi:serine/threonine protein kinase
MGTPSSKLAVGLEIGAYRVLSVIGQGGMGVVYRAVHGTTGELAALKTVRRAGQRALGALRSEISALQAIHHPGVVRVVDQGIHEGLPWYAMELLEGRTLADLNREIWAGLPVTGGWSTHATASTSEAPSPVSLAEDPPAPMSSAGPPAVRPPAAGGRLAEVLGLYRRLCEPLAHIHGRGIVHRDLKPGNVFVTREGAPVLVDFGLMGYARGTVGRESLTAGTPSIGTLSHVSPEQIQGHFVDARADLYSLGCMLYESITGRSPFRGSERDLASRHLGERPLPLSELVSGVPAELEALVLGLLAKVPQERIGYAADVAAALCRCLGEEIDRPGPSPSPDYLYRAQIAGRQELLARLSELAARAAEGAGALVLLGGESGIGKTFLVAELARQQQQLRRAVITGECVPVAGGATAFSAGALHPFGRLFQSIADDCRRGGPALTARLLGPRAALLAAYEPALAPFVEAGADLQAPELPGLAARERVLHGLTETLKALSDDGPLLLIFDDLQWADELTLAFLEWLGPAFFEQRRLLIVGTYRSEEVSPDLERLLARPVVQHLTVGRMDQRTVAAMTRDMLAMEAPPPSLIGFLSARSEGNPFFVAEYLRLLLAEALLRRVQGRWTAGPAIEGAEPSYDRLPVPQSMLGLLNRRLAGLEERSRAVIEAASVLGREFRVDHLAPMLALTEEQVSAALREACQRQVIESVDGNVHVFSHDKLRETAYAGLGTERARALHRAAGNALEGRYQGTAELPAHFAELARHFREAGEVARAIEYLDRAAGEALRKSASKEAIAFLKDAIAHADSVSVDRLRFARWHRQIGDGLQALGQPDASASYLRQAAALLDLPAPTARGRLAASVLANVGRQVLHRLFPAYFLGSGAASREALMEAARAHDRLQQVLYFSGDTLAMLHACISSLNISERAGTSAELTNAYGNAFVVAGIIPLHKLALAYRRRAGEINDRFPHAAIECYLRMLSGVYAVGTAGWDDLRRELDRGMTLAREIGFHRSFEESCFVYCVADCLQGNFAESLARANTLYASALRGDHQTQSWALIQRAHLRLVQDRAAEAQENLAAARPLVDEHDKSRVEYVWYQIVLARALLRRGDRDGSLSAAERAFERLLVSPPLYFTLIEAIPLLAEVFFEEWRSVRGPRQQQAARRLARVVKAMSMQARVFPAAAPQHNLWAGHLARLQGQAAKAVRWWERSRDAAVKLRMPYEEALAQVALASGRLPGDAERSALVDRARETFSRLGAEHDLARLGV